MRSLKVVAGVLASCLLVAGVLLWWAARQQPVAHTAELTAAEYDVFSAWMAGTFNGKDKETRAGGVVKVVIFNTTWFDEQDVFPYSDENGQPIRWEQRANSLMTEAPTLQRTTINAFREVNTGQAWLRRNLHPPIDYELVDSSQLDAIFKKRGDPWGAYYRQFPGSQGVLALSRVGISADHTQALFYFSNICGGLCGGGGYVVMEKCNGNWVIRTEIGKWMS